MFCPQVVNCNSCIGLTLPLGYNIITFTPSTPKNPLATAPPVSPLVATNTVVGLVVVLLSSVDLVRFEFLSFAFFSFEK